MEVRETTDRGMGLFATKRYAKGEYIGTYNGERIDRDELERRYGKGDETAAEYVVEIDDDEYVDDWRGMCPLSSANDPVDLELMRRYVEERGLSKSRAYAAATDRSARNSVMVLTGRKARLFASREIERGEEILWSYGSGYWKI